MPKRREKYSEKAFFINKNMNCLATAYRSTKINAKLSIAFTLSIAKYMLTVVLAGLLCTASGSLRSRFYVRGCSGRVPRHEAAATADMQRLLSPLFGHFGFDMF